MPVAMLLEIILTGLQHTADLTAIFTKATAEGRDLTPEEVAFVRSKAQASLDKLTAEA